MENSLISAEKLRQMYGAMLKLRLLAKHLHSPNRIHRTLHQHFHEASEIGSTVDLRATDTLVTLPTQQLDLSTSPSLSVLNQSDVGNPLRKTDGGWPTVIQTLHFDQRVALATGAACLHRAQDKGNLVMAFVEEDEIANARDSLRFAHDHCLPIIYVLLKNSRFEPPRRSLARKPSTMPVIPVDQIDVVAVYRVSFEAIDKARRGAGPTLIQCVRDPKSSGRRKSGQSESRDPLLYMELYLRKKDLWSDELKRNAEVDFSREARIR
jgi:TPP-dependent pyruvate/acetoin dehydrogenase alpha subunit